MRLKLTRKMRARSAITRSFCKPLALRFRPGGWSFTAVRLKLIPTTQPRSGITRVFYLAQANARSDWSFWVEQKALLKMIQGLDVELAFYRFAHDPGGCGFPTATSEESDCQRCSVPQLVI